MRACRKSLSRKQYQVSLQTWASSGAAVRAGGAPASNRATLGPRHPPQRRRDPRRATAAALRNRAERLVAGRDRTKGLPGMTLKANQTSRHAAPISPIRRKGQSLGPRSHPAMARADARGSMPPPSSEPRRLSGYSVSGLAAVYSPLRGSSWEDPSVDTCELVNHEAHSRASGGRRPSSS